MQERERSRGRILYDRITIVVGAIGITLAFFLILPLTQAITARDTQESMILDVSNALIPPPPPPPEPEKEEKEEEPEEQPELEEEIQPLDVNQLEMALNAGMSSDWLVGDLGVSLTRSAAGGDAAVNELFDMSQLDQEPQVIQRAQPIMDRKLRSRGGGIVEIIFIVNARGRVESPKVRSSSDRAYDAAALAAVRKWRFEPGQRNGEPVPFRTKTRIVFPKG